MAEAKKPAGIIGPILNRGPVSLKRAVLSRAFGSKGKATWNPIWESPGAPFTEMGLQSVESRTPGHYLLTVGLSPQAISAKNVEIEALKKHYRFEDALVASNEFFKHYPSAQLGARRRRRSRKTKRRTRRR
jgi:hypothetical protein